MALALTALAAGAGPTHAQPVQEVTLQEALDRFARDGYALRIARAEASAVSERARQEAAWPNPVFGLDREDLDSTESEHSETRVDLALPIVWPWRWSAERDAASAAAREAGARFRADSAAAAVEVVRAWLEAWEAERALSMLESATAVFRAADRAAEARYADGDLSGFDLRRLRVERARYEADLAGIRVAARAARRRLATLVAPEAGLEELRAAGEPPAVSIPPSIAVAVESARVSAPRVAAAAAAVEAARAELSGARGSRIPEPTIVGGYKRESDGLDGLVVGLTLAAPVFDRRGAAVEAARARLEEAEARLGLVTRLVEEEVRLAVERHAALLERATIQRDQLLGEAGDLLEIARVSYEAGEISLLELLDAVGAWRDALEMRAALEADLVESEHELRRATGVSIEYREEEGS